MKNNNNTNKTNINHSPKHLRVSKQTEKELRDNGKNCQEMAENFSDIIIITDKNGEKKYCNLYLQFIPHRT